MNGGFSSSAFGGGSGIGWHSRLSRTKIPRNTSEVRPSSGVPCTDRKPDWVRKPECLVGIEVDLRNSSPVTPLTP